MAANRWYIRQALGFLWTASWPAGLAPAGSLMARLTVDLYVAPGADLGARTQIATMVGMGIFALCGFRLGGRTGRTAGAAYMAVVATGLATVLAYGLTRACMVIAAAFFQPDARAWASFNEGLEIPAQVIGVLGVVLATLGAAAGRAFPRWPFLASS